MAASDFIPTGRTSVVKKGTVSFQVQTEYASRPAPRITTTILKSGQVVHKVDRSLADPVKSVVEMNRTEAAILKQHSQVTEIIQSGQTASLESLPVLQSPEPTRRPLTLAERLSNIPGRHRVFQLDNEGNFLNSQASVKFMKAFSAVFKSLNELLSVFAQVPGVGLNREQGVCEVERDRLYLVSSGTELYFFYIQQADPGLDYEQALKAALAGTS